jgi:hypothetical protein
MGELCALMLQRRLNAEVFAQWTQHHYGAPKGLCTEALGRWVAEAHRAPHALDGLRALEFDKYLSLPGAEDSAFTRALLELRNVFARNANMAMASPPPASSAHEAHEFRVPPANSELAEVLARFLCSQPRPAERSDDEVSDWVVLGQLL